MKNNNIILATEGENYQVYYQIDNHHEVTIIRENMKGFFARTLIDGVVTGPWVDVTNAAMEGTWDVKGEYWSTHIDPVDIKNLQWRINHAHMTPKHVATTIALNYRPYKGE